MTFWRPAHEWRGTRQIWFDNPKLMDTKLSELAAKAIYRCFNLIPDMLQPANDRDSLRW